MVALRQDLLLLLSVSVHIFRVDAVDGMDITADEPTTQSTDVGESSTIRKAVFNASESAELKRMLESDEDQAIIWRVENGKAIQSETNDVAFKGDMTYIIIKGKPKVRTEEWVVFYWMGKESSDTNAGDAASFTVRLDAIVHSKIHIHRETEGLESNTFKRAFAQMEGQLQFRDAAKDDSASEHLDPNVWSLFLIEETKEEIRFKSVEPSLHYLEDTKVCLLLDSEQVYVYCGVAASDSLKTITQKLAQLVLEKKPTDTKLVTIYRSSTVWSNLSSEERETLQDFVELFDQPFEAKQPQMKKRILSGDKEDEVLAIIRIHEDDEGVLSYEAVEDNSPRPISSLKTDDCYVIDTGACSGLLIWVGTKSEINEREGSARKAELYLREKNYDRATSVTFVDEEAMDIPPEAHLGDFIRFMNHLN